MGAPRLNKNKYIHHLLQSYNMMRIYNLPRRAVRSEGTSTIVGNQIGSSPNQLSQLNVNVEDLLLKIDKLEAENAKLTREQGLKHMLEIDEAALNPVAIYLKDEMTGEKEIIRERARVAEQKLRERARVAEQKLEDLKRRVRDVHADTDYWSVCGSCDEIILDPLSSSNECVSCEEEFCDECWASREITRSPECTNCNWKNGFDLSSPPQESDDSSGTEDSGDSSGTEDSGDSSGTEGSGDLSWVPGTESEPESEPENEPESDSEDDSSPDICVECGETSRFPCYKCECGSLYCGNNGTDNGCWEWQRIKCGEVLGEDSSKINWLVEKYPDGVCYECAIDAVGDE